MRFVSVSFVLMAAMTMGCKRDFNQQSAQVKDAGELRFNTKGPFKFDLITPVGQKLFKEAISWIDNQPDSRAQPANCAYNVSDVYDNAGFDGRVYNYYGSPLVLDMIDKVDRSGAIVIRFNTLDPSEFINRINSELGGKIPVGSMIAGCVNKTCDGDAGAGHIAMLGDIDADGYTQLYHNNWYRPDNEGGQWRNYMISASHYNKGCLRQWMPTPWVKFSRDGAGKIVSVKSAYPALHAIDDLDFFTYYGFIAVPKEIWKEVQAGAGTGGVSGAATASGSVCDQKHYDARICPNIGGKFPVYEKGSTKKIGELSPGEPVCTRKGLDSNGRAGAWFLMPPAGEAYFDTKYLCQCNTKELDKCINQLGGEVFNNGECRALYCQTSPDDKDPKRNP